MYSYLYNMRRSGKCISMQAERSTLGRRPTRRWTGMDYATLGVLNSSFLDTQSSLFHEHVDVMCS